MNAWVETICRVKCAVLVVALGAAATAVPALGADENAMSAITGTIAVKNIDASDRARQINTVIKLLDVTVADAAALTIAREEVPGPFAEHADYTLHYDDKAIRPRNSYIVSVEVLVQQPDGSFVRKYMTTQSYPVLTRGYGNRVDVEVNNIK